MIEVVHREEINSILELADTIVRERQSGYTGVVVELVKPTTDPATFEGTLVYFPGVRAHELFDVLDSLPEAQDDTEGSGQ